jgi:hypothetical protein
MSARAFVVPFGELGKLFFRFIFVKDEYGLFEDEG